MVTKKSHMVRKAFYNKIYFGGPNRFLVPIAIKLTYPEFNGLITGPDTEIIFRSRLRFII